MEKTEELAASIVRGEMMIEGILEDMKTTTGEIQPYVLENAGRHLLIQQSICRMEGRSNSYNHNYKHLYANTIQMNLLAEIAKLNKKEIKKWQF